MTRFNWIIIAIAYILGLLSTNILNYSAIGWNRWQLYLLLTGLICSIVGSAIAIARSNQHNISVGIIALAVAASAVVYFQLRIPQPEYNDVSYQIADDDRPLVEIAGQVLTEPRLSDRSKLKFWFDAREINGEKISGKLYATLPLLQGTGIYPGQELKISGFLYLPQPASNSNGFDFKQYLARQGSFAGIQGTAASHDGNPPKWGWWRIRQRIVRSHLQSLGSPQGQLVSSMVLGRKAVDLPSHIRDRFINAGLAHVLAASGFHVSLLLGLVLRLTSPISPKPRFAIGVSTLAVYLGLTGVQASVMRACLMGVAVLLASTIETKVKPLGSLLLAAVIILLFNPLLIDDLGFKLSFLATFGLIVTLPKLQQQLDWLPKAIAILIAIPFAASIWVLPLLCYEFNTLATYSLVVNILCTPLITTVSLGGMISGMAALILPAAGSAIASVLFYPTAWLMAIVEFFTNLPLSTWAVGQIPRSLLLAIYGLFVLIWVSKWWQKRWWLGLILPFALLTTLIINNAFRVEIAVLPSPQSPIVVIRDHGEVILINSGREDTAQYTVLPFLAQQGINQIDRAIAIDKSSYSPAAWKRIDSRTRINSIYNAGDNLFDFKVESQPLLEKITTKSTFLNIDTELAIVNLQTAEHTWLILGQSATATERIVDYIEQNPSDKPLILVWSGDIAATWLKLLQPQMAISSSNKISPETKRLLQQKQIIFHDTSITGTIRWTPQQQFISHQEIDQDNNF